VKKSFKDIPALDEQHPTKGSLAGQELAIEKIDNRVRKDIRSSGATFGILQHMDTKNEFVGRLRRKAEAQYGRTVYEVQKLMRRGESGEYPGVPAMGQRDVRQLRSSPGKKQRAEEFK